MIFKAPPRVRPAARLRLTVADRPGMLGDVTGALSAMETDIREASARTLAGGHGIISLRIEIADIAHLERVSRGLLAIDGVLEVQRL